MCARRSGKILATFCRKHNARSAKSRQLPPRQARDRKFPQRKRERFREQERIRKCTRARIPPRAQERFLPPRAQIFPLKLPSRERFPLPALLPPQLLRERFPAFLPSAPRERSRAQIPPRVQERFLPPRAPQIFPMKLPQRERFPLPVLLPPQLRRKRSPAFRNIATDTAPRRKPADSDTALSARSLAVARNTALAPPPAPVRMPFAPAPSAFVAFAGASIPPVGAFAPQRPDQFAVAAGTPSDRDTAFADIAESSESWANSWGENFSFAQKFRDFCRGKDFLKKRNPFLGDDLIKADFRLSYKRFFFSDFQNWLRLRRDREKHLRAGARKRFF